MKRRVRGTGSIERYVDSRGQDRFRARLVLATGEKKPVGVYPSRPAAESALRAATEGIVSAEVAAVTGTTLRMFGPTFLDQRERDGIRGIATERNRWKNLVDASPLADRPMAGLARRDAKEWLNWLGSRKIRYQHKHSRNGKKLSRVTKQNMLNLLRKAFDVALDDEIVKANPFAGVRLPRDPGRTHEPWTYLTLGEQFRLLAVVPVPERFAVAFAIGSGLRQGEQWSLRWVDAKNGVAVVRYGSEGQPTKSGKVRKVPLLPLAADALERQWFVCNPSRKESGLVFPAPHGGRRDKGEPHWWKDAVRAAGIVRNVRWHDLRHTCASSLVAGWWGRKWSLQEVKEMLGHASITTTERYAHLAGSEIERAAAATPGKPDESPAKLAEHVNGCTELPVIAAGATLGIRTPDLRFTKACDNTAEPNGSSVSGPAAVYQDSRPPGDGPGPAQAGGRDGVPEQRRGRDEADGGSSSRAQLTDTSSPGLLPSDPKPAFFGVDRPRLPCITPAERAFRARAWLKLADRGAV